MEKIRAVKSAITACEEELYSLKTKARENIREEMTNIKSLLSLDKIKLEFVTDEFRNDSCHISIIRAKGHLFESLEDINGYGEDFDSNFLLQHLHDDCDELATYFVESNNTVLLVD